MKRRNAENMSLGEVLKEFIQSNARLHKGLNKVHAGQAWNVVMGESISRYTTDVRLIQDTLHVRLSSSVLREELLYGKDKIIRMLNEEIGRDLIKNLVLK